MAGTGNQQGHAENAHRANITTQQMKRQLEVRAEKRDRCSQLAPVLKVQEVVRLIGEIKPPPR